MRRRTAERGVEIRTITSIADDGRGSLQDSPWPQQHSALYESKIKLVTSAEAKAAKRELLAQTVKDLTRRTWNRLFAVACLLGSCLFLVCYCDSNNRIALPVALPPPPTSSVPLYTMGVSDSASLLEASGGTTRSSVDGSIWHRPQATAAAAAAGVFQWENARAFLTALTDLGPRVTMCRQYHDSVEI
jgi:hypothetical protein